MTSCSSQPYRYRHKNGGQTVGVKLASAGVAACCADLLTFPLDMAKVRMQIADNGLRGTTLSGSRLGMGVLLPSQRPTMLRTLYQIGTREGPRALYSGLCAGLQRQLVFASIRVGLYDDVKTKYQHLLGRDQNHKHGFDVRILSGLTTGAVSVMIGQPTDVVKIRMQAQGATGKVLYAGTLNAYKRIATTEGVRGLWKGLLPNVTRNSITNVAELVTYDVIKEYILRHNYLNDNFVCHVTSGLGAGFIATLTASPVDVVKTRYMNSLPGTYTGVWDCTVKMIAENGPMSLYKGFVPAFIRFASWNIVMFVCFERAKLIFSKSIHQPDIKGIIMQEKL